MGIWLNNEQVQLDHQDRNLLHVKPMSHRIWSITTTIGTHFQQKADPNRWQGRGLILIVKGMTGAGYLVNLAIGCIELIAATAFLTLVFFLHASTRFKLKSLTRIQYQTLAYVRNVISISSLQMNCLTQGTFSNKHGCNEWINRFVHVNSAMTAQKVRWIFNKNDERQEHENHLYIERTLHIFHENLFMSSSHIVASVAEDFAWPKQNPNFQNFFMDVGDNINHIEDHIWKSFEDYLVNSIENNFIFQAQEDRDRIVRIFHLMDNVLY